MPSALIARARLARSFPMAALGWESTNFNRLGSAQGDTMPAASSRSCGSGLPTYTPSFPARAGPRVPTTGQAM